MTENWLDPKIAPANKPLLLKVACTTLLGDFDRFEVIAGWRGEQTRSWYCTSEGDGALIESDNRAVVGWIE